MQNQDQIQTITPFLSAVIGIIIATIVFVSLLVVLMRRYRRKQARSVSSIKSAMSGEKLKSDIILNAIEDGVVLIDNQKIIRLFNPAASRISGWAAEEAVNLDYHSVIHLVDERSVEYTEQQNPFSLALAKGAAVRDNKAVLVTRSNKHVSMSLTVSPLFDGYHNVSGTVGIFRDISEERNEEEHRADFISTASHEMRTPVAAIEGYLALALNDHVSKIDSKAREYLEKAHSSTQSLGKLFQDLLTSAKAEDGRLVSHPVVVEMGEYLEKLADSLRFMAEKKGLILNFLVGIDNNSSPTVSGRKTIQPFYYVYVDPDRMREVVTNLFDNAVKYTSSGKITIGLTGNNEIVQFYIKDTGPGIPPEDVPHLFQKFYRVDSSVTRTIGGTGLGLFICRKIVELYNGRLWVTSKLNEGSTFYINLPRLKTQKATELQGAEAAQKEFAPS